MTNTTARTPGPWSVVDNRDLNGAFWIEVEHPTVGNVSLAEVRSGCEEADELGSPEANAAFIVRCVNSHDELVAVVQELIADAKWQNTPYELRAKARAALAKATTP